MNMEDRLDDIASRAMQTTGAPSLSIAALKNGEMCYARTFGEAGTQSIYSIASVTKQFTAACVLLLARENALSLDDTVSGWFPELTRAGEITLRHLLSHTSGYPDYYPLGFPDDEKLHATAPEEIVRRYATQPLQFEPGTAWSYSNTGYHIAGLIVERVAGMPFGAFLTRNVLDPAGMKSAYFNDPPQKNAEHLDGCTRYCLGPRRETQDECAGWTYSSGGIACSAADLARWHAVLMNGALLSAEEVRLAMTPVPLEDPGPSAPALGWFAERRGEHTVVQHSGGVAGFSSQTIVCMEERASLVVLSNGDYVQTGALANRLFEQLLPGAQAPQPQAVAQSADLQQRMHAWVEQFAAGTVDRSRLTPPLAAFLTDTRLADAALGLSAQGALNNIEPIAGGERGSMTWCRARAEFANAQADVMVRETANGGLAEFNAFPIP